MKVKLRTTCKLPWELLEGVLQALIVVGIVLAFLLGLDFIRTTIIPPVGSFLSTHAFIFISLFVAFLMFIVGFIIEDDTKGKEDERIFLIFIMTILFMAISAAWVIGPVLIWESNYGLPTGLGPVNWWLFFVSFNPLMGGLLSGWIFGWARRCIKIEKVEDEKTVGEVK